MLPRSPFFKQLMYNSSQKFKFTVLGGTGESKSHMHFHSDLSVHTLQQSMSKFHQPIS